MVEKSLPGLVWLRRFAPKPVVRILGAPYHWLLARLGAWYYRHPSREIFLVGVTGTKGKTTTSELVNAVWEKAGYKTALASTLRFKIADYAKPNELKMTMPGRLFLQRFLRRAVSAGCTHAIVEMTSEGARQFRHLGLEMDALIFTNLAPEHIESHGSYAAYRGAKLKLAHALARSRKPLPTLVINEDDREAKHFLAVPAPRILTYGWRRGAEADERGIKVPVGDEVVRLNLPGRFNVYNALAAAALAAGQNIKPAVVRQAFAFFTGVAGRMEAVASAPFLVIVDYAHTPDSLKQAYESLPKNGRKICVLGATGGGRDRWKRPLLGRIAGEYCDKIFITDEDPYDEPPRQIAEAVARGISKPIAEIIMDRRQAIRAALGAARMGDVVIITGKGTDPCICGPRGQKIPWSDAVVVREELTKLKIPGEK